MNQDSSFPPMLPPSTELGALLFAALPCLQEGYRPLASFAFHLMELSRLKQLPPIPAVSQPKSMDALIADKEGMLRSLSFYGKLFRMPFLSMLASLLQGMQFYNTYKDLLPGLFSGTGNGSASPFDSMTALFSGLSGTGGITPDVFSALGNLSPDFLASLASAFQNVPTASTTAPDLSGTNKTNASPTEAVMASSNPPATVQTSAPDTPVDVWANASDTPAATKNATVSPDTPGTDTLQTNLTAGTDASPIKSHKKEASSAEAQQASTTASSAGTQQNTSDALYDSLYTFMTPEQKEIYLRLMNTD